MITLRGYRFGSSAGTIKIGGVTKTPTSWTDTEIVVNDYDPIPNTSVFIEITNTSGGSFTFYYQVPSNNYFDSTSVRDGSVVDSYIDRSALSAKLQSDTYFDSTSEIYQVMVTYVHQDGRQKKNIIHSGSDLVGPVSWGSAKDGTWQKTRITVYDSNGAQSTLLRPSISSTEDLIHSDGTMVLNSW